MQGDVLSELKGADHIIELLGKGECRYNGGTWSAMLVAPLVQRLHDVDDLTLFGQVFYAHWVRCSLCA